MKNKVKIEIDKTLYENLSNRFEKEKLSLVAINVNNTDEFIEYILKNFDVSSKQFETLNDQQKNAFNNIDFNNIDINDLVKTLSESLSGANSKKEEKPIKKNNDNKNKN